MFLTGARGIGVTLLTGLSDSLAVFRSTIRKATSCYGVRYGPVTLKGLAHGGDPLNLERRRRRSSQLMHLLK
jgi:hypothetical protein